MFRNICVLALVVLCGHTASAFSMNMIMGMASKFGGQVVSMGMTCLEKNNAGEVLKNPSPANFVHACGCLAGCMMQAVGVMQADGKMNTALITNNMPESLPMVKQMKQILTDCSGKGGDTCSAPLAFVKCTIADGPFKEIMNAAKSWGTAMAMEIVKSVM